MQKRRCPKPAMGVCCSPCVLEGRYGPSRRDGLSTRGTWRVQDCLQMEVARPNGPWPGVRPFMALFKSFLEIYTVCHVDARGEWAVSLLRASRLSSTVVSLSPALCWMALSLDKTGLSGRTCVAFCGLGPFPGRLIGFTIATCFESRGTPAARDMD